MEKTPSNEAVTEQFSQWFYAKAKSLEKWLKGSSSIWAGSAAKRYDKLYSRSFDEVEAAELLHSASFQKKLGDTGADSQNKQKFDRYAVVVPCKNFDPAYEFRMKFKWSERALVIARKANEKFSSVADSRGGFVVELRGAGVLSMTDERNAWMTYFTHQRAAGFGFDLASVAWVQSRNPWLNEMTGTLAPSSDIAIKASDLRGFKVQFACGTRVDMHNFPQKVLTDQAHMPSFASCVKQGAKQNAELLAANPTKPFIPEETVVRVRFSSVTACYVDKDASLAKNTNETENPVFRNFLAVSGCNSISQAGTLPTDLMTARDSSTYRGLLLGEGLPEETLLELLLDPQDVIGELGL